jgi:glycosyltransferase involved in cell wall biosynthesis
MKLSIITISFNAEECIEKTIESVLNQSVPVFEYIMIDGASSDHTYDIIKSYDEKFQNRGIHFIHISEPDKGISDAFNKGVKLAEGDIIGIINADDELLPDANAILQEEWEKVKADVYYGNCWWVDTGRNIEYISRPRQDLSLLLHTMILIHPSTFVAKKAYDECGVFNVDYRYCMDKDLLYRLYKSGKSFKYIDAELTRFKAGGVSDKNLKAVLKEGEKNAIYYGAPFLKTKVMFAKKYVKNKIIILVKKTPLYLFLYRRLKNGRGINR